MKYILFFLSGLIISSYCTQAQAMRLENRKINTDHCSPVGDSSYHVRCHEFKNGDTIHIRPTDPFANKPTQLNLFVTRAMPNNNYNHEDLFVPYQSNYPIYSVAEPISITHRKIGKGRKRRAIVYKLNYTDQSGTKGFQIITIRLGILKKQNCTVAVRDSKFFNYIPLATREEYMRDEASHLIRDRSLLTAPCLPPESSQSSEEGDSFETDV